MKKLLFILALSLLAASCDSTTPVGNYNSGATATIVSRPTSTPASVKKQDTTPDTNLQTQTLINTAPMAPFAPMYPK